MAEQYLTSGIKINVDISDLDIKFAKSADELNRTLSKSQRALGLQYDENQRLVDSQGRVVEGLTLAQIRLGQYVDELGRVRTFQDGFAQELTKTEQELGFFADEFGNVFNRTGELVRVSSEVSASLDGMSDAGRETRNAFGDLGSQAAMIFTSLAGLNGEFKKVAVGVAAVGEGISVFADVSRIVDETASAMKNFRAGADAAAAGTTAFAAATGALTAPGGWLSLGIGAVAGLVAGIATYVGATSEAESQTEIFGVSLEKLRERAREAGVEIKHVSDMLALANAAEIAGYGEQKTAIDDLIEAQKKLAAARRVAANAAETPTYAGQGGGVGFTQTARAVRDAQREYEDAAAEVGGWIAELSSRYITQTQRLEMEIEQLDRVVETERANGATADKIGALLDLRAKIEADLNAEKKRELDGEKGGNDDKKPRLNIDFGGLDAAAAKQSQEKLLFTVESFSRDSARLQDLVAQGLYSQIEMDNIISAAIERNSKLAEKARADAAEKEKKELEKAQKDALNSWGYVDLEKATKGVVSPLMELGDRYDIIALDAQSVEGLQTQAATALAGIDHKLADYYDKIAQDAEKSDVFGGGGAGFTALADAQRELEQALRDSKISSGYYIAATEALANARRREAERVDRRREEEKKAQQKSFHQQAEDYLEAQKAPWERYEDKIADLDKKFADGFIESARDLNILKTMAYEDFLSELPEPEQSEQTEATDWTAKIVEFMNSTKSNGATSAASGSADLYRMQVAQQNDLQTQMLTSVTQIGDAFASLNSLVFSIRERLLSDVKSREYAVYRGTLR